MAQEELMNGSSRWLDTPVNSYSPEPVRKYQSAPREFMFAPLSPSILHFFFISKNLLHIRAGY